jgi:hypothetical protein
MINATVTLTLADFTAMREQIEVAQKELKKWQDAVFLLQGKEKFNTFLRDAEKVKSEMNMAEMRRLIHNRDNPQAKY